MEIRYFCPHWGSKDMPFSDFTSKAKKSGFDGVELSLPLDLGEKKTILNAINKANLFFLAQHWETSTLNFKDHKVEYRARLENLASANPLLINSQTGKDFFRYEQNAELISIAADVSAKYVIKIIHETHRGKFSFAAHIAEVFMNRMPDLRIGFDLSHWCNVAESYLHDQQSAVDLAISRADHIHARVGFPEGPQIPDPRVPEWKEAVDIHIEWWKRIVERNKTEGKTFFTVTPEFGPYPYMTILPYTRQPISNQWDINTYMMEMLRSILTAR